MKMQDERQAIVAYGQKMSAQGLAPGTSGNLSCFDPQTGLMAIGPSGLDYDAVTPLDVVVLDLNGKLVEGFRKPSSEHGLHAAFYRRKPHVRAVVHTHSPFCTTFACLGKPLRAVHFAIAGAGSAEVPCAPYQTFGTPELAESAVSACGAGSAVLLANHGLVACGPNLYAAFALAVNLEFVAELQWRCMAVGDPVVLRERDLAGAIEGFRHYGQS